jgi:DNA-binding transcriptional LysR family regulator
LLASDMVSILPRRTAEELVCHRPLVIRPLSHSSPIIETAMIWPRRLDNQPAHCWLRDIVGRESKSLRSK